MTNVLNHLLTGQHIEKIGLVSSLPVEVDSMNTIHFKLVCVYADLRHK